MQVGEHDLGRGDEVEPLGRLEEVFLELGQLARAGEGLLVRECGNPPLGGAPLDVFVEHEVDERALEAGTGTMQCVEARVGEFHATLEVDDAELRAEVPMRLGLEVELARRAPAAYLGIIVLVIADGRVGAGNVGNGIGEAVELFLDSHEGAIKIVDLVTDVAHANLGVFGLFGVALLEHGANLFGDGVALGFERLDFLDDFAAFFIEATELVVIPFCMAVLQSLFDGVGVLANEANVEHCSSCACARCAVRNVLRASIPLTARFAVPCDP